MAVAYVSQNNSGWVTSTSTDVPKPAGLAVGDLLIAYMSSNGNSVALPSGFSEAASFTATDGTLLATFLAYKIADAGDVAATNFTFNVGASAKNFCAIVRVSGNVNLGSLLVANSGRTDNTATPALTGITPNSRGDSLILQFWSGICSSISGYAIATSNPSWTEVYDISDSGQTVALAWAVRPQTTATGNFSCAGGSGSSDWAGFIIAIAPAWSFTINESLTPTELAVKASPSILVNESLTLEETVTVEKERIWNETTKPETDWNFTDK